MNNASTFDFQVGQTVGDIAGLAGNEIVHAIVNTVPYTLPVLAVLWGIRYTLAKIGLN